MSSAELGYTPPLGSGDTAGYDSAVRRWTRERLWRTAIVELLAARPGESLVDVGCGTGTMAVLLKQAHPELDVLGLDPDEQALSIAQAKASSAGVRIEWRQGFADILPAGAFDAAVSSLVLHQVPMAGKRACLKAIWVALKPGGRLVLADYGKQTGFMKFLFRQTVQRLDGVTDTEPNARGCLPALLADAGFFGGLPRRRIPTLTGMIDVFVARKPG